MCRLHLWLFIFWKTRDIKLFLERRRKLGENRVYWAISYDMLRRFTYLCIITHWVYWNFWRGILARRTGQTRNSANQRHCFSGEYQTNWRRQIRNSWVRKRKGLIYDRKKSFIRCLRFTWVRGKRAHLSYSFPLISNRTRRGCSLLLSSRESVESAPYGCVDWW